jgi:hypothetical protein
MMLANVSNINRDQQAAALPLGSDGKAFVF